jgi:hypothetical protein
MANVGTQLLAKLGLGDDKEGWSTWRFNFCWYFRWFRRIELAATGPRSAEQKRLAISGSDVGRLIHVTICAVFWLGGAQASPKRSSIAWRFPAFMA